MSLKTKVINGVIWVSINKLFLKLINFVITIILARLLTPADFGLVSLALIFVNFFEISRDLGMESALIHEEGSEEEKNKAFNTAFILYPAFALLLYILSYIMAPYAGYFFANQNIEPVIRALLITIVIWSFGTIPRTLLRKNLDFKKMLLPQILPRISYGTIAIVMAYLGYGVWSLVIGRIILEITSVIVYWKSLEWRPSFTFSKSKALELFSFGKFVMVSSLIAFLLSSIDVATIGRVLEMESLGYYTISLSVAGLITIQMAAMVSQVMFPTYSKLQNDIEKMKEAHFSTIKIFSILVFPAAFGMITISKNFIETVYGEKWLPAVHILQILCIYGLCASFININTSVFLAVGKPQMTTLINSIQLLLIALLIYPLTKEYGIIGTSFSITIPAILMSIYSFIESSKLLDQNVTNMIKNIFPAVKGTFLMLIIIFLLQELLHDLTPRAYLVIKIIIAAFTYFAYVLTIHRGEINIDSLKNTVKCQLLKGQ